MNMLRYIIPGVALAFAASTPTLAQTLGATRMINAAQMVAPQDLRDMSAAEFQRHIDEEGAAQFVQRFERDADPHAPEEPNYDIVLEHVAEGQSGWLRAAAEVAPYADPVFSQGLKVAIADALIANPAAVLRMIGAEEHFNDACGYPFVQQTVHYLQKHQHEALAALRRVHDPALATRKASCHQQLLNVPTKAIAPDGDNTPQDTAFGTQDKLF